MRITKDTVIAEAVELVPGSMELFRAMGLCCVTDENGHWNIERLCEEYAVEPEALLSAIAALEPAPGKKQGCMLCGKKLVYKTAGEHRRCAVCGKSVWSHEECEDGHFVCNDCHSAPGAGVLGILADSSEKDPGALMETLWKMPEIHMFGPEHHWLVPCVLLTAYRNNGGEIDLPTALKKAWERGRKVSGGSCGYWGVCGAAVGMGIYFSLLYDSSPLSENWKYPQELTAECLSKIAECAGPRCCKRTCRTAVEVAVRYTKERFGVAMPLHWRACAYSGMNKECMHADCPYCRKPTEVSP